MPSRQLLKGRASSLSRVKVGDVVVRYLAGELRMELTVTEITHGRIICGAGNLIGRLEQKLMNYSTGGPRRNQQDHTS
jgi:hypothetical protein